uniref:Uncharacterized protein n=1 Tax=Molossus molossus TaxID=27622 RepID=A0A7J8CZ99_MOLMO|nr:hypothetical protein HJG59_009556 [Molossus molossus]
MVLMSLLMLLSFLKIMALNSTSDHLLSCILLISSSIEFSCFFIWDLFLCFTILAISVGFRACQIFPVDVFCCFWLSLLGLDEPGWVHIKHHCQVLLSWVDLQAQEGFNNPLPFSWWLVVSVTQCPVM